MRRDQIKPEEAQRLVSEGALLVDVRTPAEFNSGHLPGAINLPLNELGKRVSELEPKEQPIVLYCASGMRSRGARRVLQSAGFTAVSDLGSASRWR
ncbi:MAG: rhodanese-like domain-containing protein [Myxococcales bacterium]|nr:rhodanese-like domain-containing protein [Myxococcales bacterium]